MENFGLGAAENSTDLTTMASTQNGLILIHRSLKANIPGQRWQLQGAIGHPRFFYFSVLPHVASHLRVDSWDKITARPPAVAAALQTTGRGPQGDGTGASCL